MTQRQAIQCPGVEQNEHLCPECGAKTQYQTYSGGREWYCPSCKTNGPYGDGEAPRRAAMLTTPEGRTTLRGEMREHLAAPKSEGDLYFCPTVGEIESATHGGFDVCCAHPELHTYLGYSTPGIEAISDYLSEKARADFSRTCDTFSPGIGETPIGPCILRHGHWGTTHQAADGAKWSPSTHPPFPVALEHVTRGGILERVTTAIARHSVDDMWGEDQSLPPRNHASWREWDKLARVAVLAYAGGVEDTEHLYLSTSCRHREHGYCQSNTGSQGQKIPAVCKFCQAPCICSCHMPGEVAVVERTVKDIVTGTDEDCCGAEPPSGEFTAADGARGMYGDCWCTLPGDHEGDHTCEPCAERYGAPPWPREGSDDENLREHNVVDDHSYRDAVDAPLDFETLRKLKERLESDTLARRTVRLPDQRRLP
jgi:hypothetical protein